MARPRGSRNIRGWTITPTEMTEAGLVPIGMVERVTQGGIEVTQLTDKGVAYLENLLRRSSGESIISETLKEQLETKAKEAKGRSKAAGTQIERTIRREEQKIRNNPYETGILVTQDGRVFRQKGEQFSVMQSFEQRANAAGSVFTHNHPRAISDEGFKGNPVGMKIGGNSLSSNDVYNFYSMKNLEKRAVTPKLVFSIKNSAWERENKESEAFKRGESKRFKKAYQRNKKKVSDNLDNAVLDGKITRNEASAAYWHLVNRDFAAKKRGFGANLSYSVSGDKTALAELARIEKAYDQSVADVKQFIKSLRSGADKVGTGDPNAKYFEGFI